MKITEKQYNCIAIMEDVFKSYKNDNSLNDFYKNVLKEFLCEFEKIKVSVGDRSMTRKDASKFIGKYMQYSKEINKELECNKNARLRALECELRTLSHEIIPH